MGNYILAQRYARANVQDSLWYVMGEDDKDTLMREEQIAFGDKCYVITTKKVYICGNDAKWYPM